MTRCPLCFHQLSDDVYAWVCTSTSCPAKPDQLATSYSGFPVSLRQGMVVHRPQERSRGWQPPAVVHCPACGSSTSAQVCTNCHYGPLPADWRQSSATCVAMAGARATGKSLYVGVAVKQLELLAAKLRTTLEFANDRTRQVYRTRYERPLYEERGLMQPTATVNVDSAYQREPLIFSLGMLNGQRRYLVVRDVAGEDLEADTVDVAHLQFFGHADGVLFLFDPLRVGAVRNQLQGIVPAHGLLGGDPQTVLSNVLRLIGTRSPRLAVVVSKFDALQELRAVSGTTWSKVMSNSGAATLRDPSVVEASWNADDGYLVHHEVRSILLALGAESIVLSVERPNNGHPLEHRFFAVSALGESPRGEKLHSRGIAPYRCLDPLKWILANNGVL